MEIEDVLAIEEGYRESAYYCTEGYPTIGIGQKIGPRGAPLEYYTLTVSESVAKMMLSDELRAIRSALIKYKWYTRLDHDRKIIVESMCYQMGVNGVLKFKKMISALSSGDYAEAAFQALDSEWAKQTPNRAERHSDVIISGDIDSVYGGLM